MATLETINYDFGYSWLDLVDYLELIEAFLIESLETLLRLMFSFLALRIVPDDSLLDALKGQ